jgi:hypothetical protein
VEVTSHRVSLGVRRVVTLFYRTHFYSLGRPLARSPRDSVCGTTAESRHYLFFKSARRTLLHKK